MCFSTPVAAVLDSTFLPNSFNTRKKLIQHFGKLIQHFLNKCLNRIIYMLKWYIKNVELLYSNVGIIIQKIQITYWTSFCKINSNEYYVSI